MTTITMTTNNIITTIAINITINNNTIVINAYSNQHTTR